MLTFRGPFAYMKYINVLLHSANFQISLYKMLLAGDSARSMHIKCWSTAPGLGMRLKLNFQYLLWKLLAWRELMMPPTGLYAPLKVLKASITIQRFFCTTRYQAATHLKTIQKPKLDLNLPYSPVSKL